MHNEDPTIVCKQSLDLLFFILYTILSTINRLLVSYFNINYFFTNFIDFLNLIIYIKIAYKQSFILSIVNRHLNRYLLRSLTKNQSEQLSQKQQ